MWSVLNLCVVRRSHIWPDFNSSVERHSVICSVNFIYLLKDVQPCAAIEELVEKFNVLKMCGSRSWHVQACDARFGNGLVDGLEWLSHQLVNVLAGPSE